MKKCSIVVTKKINYVPIYLNISTKVTNYYISFLDLRFAYGVVK